MPQRSDYQSDQDRIAAECVEHVREELRQRRPVDGIRLILPETWRAEGQISERWQAKPKRERKKR